MTSNIPAHVNNQLGLIVRLRQRLNDKVELMTGLAASGRDELTLSLGHVLQGALKLQFFETLMDEIDSYRDKGRIKDEDFQTKQGQACFMEMLNFLDEDNPDDIRFEFMKKLYLGIMSDDDRDRSSFLPQQYMQVSRRLSSGELIVLTTTYLASKENPDCKGRRGAVEWVSIIAEKSGLSHRGLVEIHEKGLEQKMLITPRTHADKSGVTLGNHFRLTDFGVAICRFIENIE